MKLTQTVDRTLTPKDGTTQPGVITEFMVDNRTTPIEHGLGTYVTILPGGKSQMRRHNDAELAWYLMKGHIRHIIVEADGTRTESECGEGAVGYIAPGDAHQEINLSITDRAEIVMIYTNPMNKKCNCFADTGTEVVAD